MSSSLATLIEEARAAGLGVQVTGRHTLALKGPPAAFFYARELRRHEAAIVALLRQELEQEGRT